MLDEQDATNRDAKGLPFTVRVFETCFEMHPHISAYRSEQSLWLIPKRPSVSLLPTPPLLVATLTRSFGELSIRRDSICVLISALFSVIDCNYLRNWLSIWWLTAPTALQIGDKHRVTTPVNWKKGEDVIVHPGVTNDEAKTLFPQFSQHLVSHVYHRGKIC